MIYLSTSKSLALKTSSWSRCAQRRKKANSQSEASITQLKSQLTASQADAAELTTKVQQMDTAHTGFFNDIAQYQQELGAKNKQLETLRTTQEKANSQSETNITQLKSQLTASQTDAASHKNSALN